MPLEFTGSKQMTLGCEVELQLLDRETCDLSPVAPRIFDLLGGQLPNVKAEIFQSMIEITSDVSPDVATVRRGLEAALAKVAGVAEQVGFHIVGAGSHPFARHRDRVVFPAPRFQHLIERNQWIARRLMIFGLHVHVGMRDGEHAVAMMNAMLPYLPHLLAISASSPFWEGTDTGLASSRTTVFESLPTAGHPCTFDSWRAFERYYESALASKSIGSIKDIWWDIRPQPELGTLEIRVCDGLPTLSEAVSVVALVQCLMQRFDMRYREGGRYVAPSPWIIRENKWRASRWGLDATIVTDESGATATLRHEVLNLLDELQGIARHLGCSDELARLRLLVDDGGSYTRQRRVHQRHGSLRAVVESLVWEHQNDRPLPI